MAGFFDRISGKWKRRLVNMTSDVTGILPLANMAPSYFTNEAQTPTASTPSDSQIYYFGRYPGAGLTTTANLRKEKVLVNCTLIGASITAINLTSIATSETSTLNFRVNNTTNTLLSNSIVFTGSPPVCSTQSVTGLSVNLSSGDEYEIQWLTPAWVTNPSNCAIFVTLYFTPR